ncbi:MAG: hypothetical protein IT534_14875 [Bauldia sp.]|nr:hypothetical protein [Bauldia sp.]
MHAVVNHLSMRSDADWNDIARRFAVFAAGVKRDYPAMKTAVLVRVAASEAVFMGVYDDAATMEHVSSKVAAPWFAEHVRPYLAAPAVRSSGEVIGGFVRG